MYKCSSYTEGWWWHT